MITDAPFVTSPNNCYFDNKTPPEDLKCEVRFNVNPNATFRSVTENDTGEITITKYNKTRYLVDFFWAITSSKIPLVKSIVQSA